MAILYIAPINMFGNNSFRQLCLDNGADFVFTELIWIEDVLDRKGHALRKLKISDAKRTIVQVCSKDGTDIAEGIEIIKRMHPGLDEINYNMGCPQSTLAKENIAGGILNDMGRMDRISKEFIGACRKNGIFPSVKLRIGPRPDKILIEKYLELLSSNGIKKFYIHARTLRHSYDAPAIPEKLEGLKGNFPDLKLIYNGDITSYQSYKKIESLDFDGVMIGRKALEDPRIFDEIKKKQESLNINQFPFDHKKNLLLDFLDIVEKDELELPLIKLNLNYLTREVEGGKAFRKKLNNTKTLQEVKKLVQNSKQKI